MIALYCAPKFTTLKELYRYTSSYELCKNCLWIRPKDNVISINDKESHIYLYNKNKKKCELRSSNSNEVECEDFNTIFGFNNDNIVLDDLFLDSDVSKIEPINSKQFKEIITNLDSPHNMFFILF